MGQIELGNIGAIFETRIGMCTYKDGAYVVRDGDRLEPRYKEGEFTDTVGEAFTVRESVRASLKEAGVDYRDPGSLRLFLADPAEEKKRAGDLEGAFSLYAALFGVEDKWDIMFARRLTNLFLLDKNFVDLEKTLRYIHAFAVRVNKDKLKQGVSLDIGTWGTNVVWGAPPFLDFSSYVPFHVLNAINGGYEFTSKESIAECARARGGSPYWANYTLSDADFVQFIMVFGQGL